MQYRENALPCSFHYVRALNASLSHEAINPLAMTTEVAYANS
jgi:hypothetical protein